ncbi:MAG: glycosyltransferase family 4 protein, partial [Candidatus Omnitrophica bacterium]|nr:glycosyltransferase family 4 protein [Candidatus Omnitrophota bacterium]
GIDAHAIGLKQGGNETYALGLLRGLFSIKHPYFNYIVFLSENVPVPEFLLDNEHFSIVRIPRLAYLRFLRDIPIKTYTEKLDLLHTQYHLPLISHCPGIITLHDVSFLRYPEFFPKDIYWRLRISLLYSVRKAKKIITVSEFSKKEIINFYQIENDKVDVVYNGVSENFRPVSIEKNEKVLKKYGITKPYILSVSNLQPRKNLCRLIKAFVFLVKNNERFPYKLVIVGKKLWLYNEIFDEIRNSNFIERIVLTDYVPEQDLVYLYNCAEVFVYPSLYEGFGLPVLEAMACGCPVITSNISSLPEIAGNACILIDPYDIDAIAKAIHIVLTDIDLRARLKTAGLKQSQKFSWRRTAEETIKVYDKVLL